MNRNPYSLMHENNKYKYEVGQNHTEEKKTEEEKERRIHISYGVDSGLHQKVLEQQASVSRQLQALLNDYMILNLSTVHCTFLRK